MNFFEVVLVGIFVIGAVGIGAGVVAMVVSRVRDRRTTQERFADEHGDMAPGSVKITPGYAANQIGGMWH